MNKIFVPNAIATLTRLFYSSTTLNEYLAMRTAQFYIEDLKLLQDVEAVALAIEDQNAFALMSKFKLFDYKAAEEIEIALSASGYTEAELNAMNIEI
ncbi:hypothetical protein ACFWDG_03950 [Peribacillus sp. NPDC060186]|jgi:hypothetical protein|uniref:hypothetical protein n=1 Tax=Peribacillus TaxID=2675229 RepID=UPI0019142E85|nr:MULTISPECIES: hypothetical protein [Peribacillus]MBK5444939.1 hypothetical protein [Peribacillus sp. TH24]MBK5460342.1 hypothetical protein [Peribacillus sp. TH27]MBK5482139.1 hypothetical protein [Peribacillus sp. TH16]MBK5498516.1 hypothetical protein [Peribacillus sp. TH14]MED3690272.1 hypothetical protein [Peribacillus butanolivorans]